MKRYPLVSVVVLNFNGMPYVEQCLRSVLGADYPNFEVVFVDNASSDRSLAYVKKRFGGGGRLRIIVNDRNYGFAEGNNIGIRHAKGEHFVLLNIDTEVEPSWLRGLVRVMESNGSIGVAQSKLLRMDNPRRFDTCGHMLTPYGFTMERGSGEVDDGQYDYVAEILGAKGAAMIIRRRVLEEVGAFDPDYFALREETDLCWRVWLRGYRVVFVPNSVVCHAVRGVSKHVARDAFTLYWRRIQLFYWHRNGLITLLKNLELRGVVKVIPLHLLLAFGDALIGSMRERSLHPLLSMIKAVMWIMANLKCVWRKRVAVQYLIRKRRDEEIMPHIMVKATILDKLREKAGISLG